MKAKVTPAPSSRSLPPPTREQIAALAYALWQDRGSPAGSDLDIWLEAERMLQTGVVVRSINGDIPADPGNPDRDPAVDGGKIDEALDRIVQPAQQRSPTAL